MYGGDVSASVVTLLVICVALLLVGGLLLFVAVGVLAWFFRGGSSAPVEPASPVEPTPVPVAPASRVGPTVPSSSPEPSPSGLEPVPVVPPSDLYMKAGEDDGKTEVFSRGSLNVDWDDEDEEGEATEIFRADIHGGFNVE